MIEVGGEEEVNKLLKKEEELLCMFGTTFCPYCNTFKPIFEEKSKNSDDKKFVFVVLDDYDNPLWEKYKIEVTPSLLFFKNGKLDCRLDGTPGVGIRRSELDLFLKNLK